jgi:ribosomal protein L3
MENIVLYDKEPSTNIVRGTIDLYSIIYANELKKSTKQEKYDYMLLKLIQEKDRETEEAKKKRVLYSDFQKAKKSIAEKYSVMEYELKEKYFGVKRICKITKDTFKGNTSKILYRNYFLKLLEPCIK